MYQENVNISCIRKAKEDLKKPDMSDFDLFGYELAILKYDMVKII